MKSSAIAVSVCFGMVPSLAWAFDWSLRTSQSETIELNDNQFLKTFPAPSVGSYSTITANAQARTPISRFDIDADGTYRKWWGPGTEGVQSEALNYGFKARYEQNEKNRFDREFLETSWRQQSTFLAILSDLGVATNARGFLDRLTATGGIDRSITARDSLSLLATSTSTSYEPSNGGIPFTDTLARGSWRHSLSPVTALSASSEVELLAFENATNSRVQIYRNQIGIGATLSPVLSFRGNIGAVYLVTEGGVNPLAGAAPSNRAVSSSLTDWIGDAVLTYEWLKNTTLVVTASQSIAPSIVGTLFKRDIVSASLNHVINTHSRLSFSASNTRQISVTTTDYASASVTYAYNFTRDLSAQLTYRYQHRFASSGTTTIDPITGIPTVGGFGPASSNSIMLTVTNNYVVLPYGN